MMPLDFSPTSPCWSFDAAEDAAARTLTSLVADLSPVELTFTAIGHEQTYFRHEPEGVLTAVAGDS